MRQNPDGKWEAVCREGKYAGWALQKTEDLAREKAVARLHYYRDYT